MSAVLHDKLEPSLRSWALELHELVRARARARLEHALVAWLERHKSLT